MVAGTTYGIVNATEKEKKRIHDEIAFFQSKLEKVQQDEKSNQRKKSEEMTREPTEIIELDSE